MDFAHAKPFAGAIIISPAGEFRQAKPCASEPSKAKPIALHLRCSLHALRWLQRAGVRLSLILVSAIFRAIVSLHPCLAACSLVPNPLFQAVADGFTPGLPAVNLPRALDTCPRHSLPSPLSRTTLRGPLRRSTVCSPPPAPCIRAAGRHKCICPTS